MSAYSADMMPVTFCAGPVGRWRIGSITTLRGEGLDLAPRLERVEGAPSRLTEGCVWSLRGVTSHARYMTTAEKAVLDGVQPGLGRPEANRAVLIPMRKSSRWWTLPQDARRAIFEEGSHHTRIGLEYLPAVARRLYHARDLGEPFDFLTWFEFAESTTGAYDTLLGRLRETEEWQFVDREVEIRLSLD